MTSRWEFSRESTRGHTVFVTKHDTSTARGGRNMADSISTLTSSQTVALEQLQAITNGGDPDVAIGVLASVDWDVQVSTAACLQHVDLTLVYASRGLQK